MFLSVSKLPKKFTKRFFTENVHVPAKIVKLSIQTPHQSVFLDHECEVISLPGSVGEYTVSPNSAPTFSQLSPGIIKIQNQGKFDRFFVSGGFASFDINSFLNVTVGECFNVQDLDIESAKKILSHASAGLSSNDEKEKAVSKIAVDTSNAIIRALETN